MPVIEMTTTVSTNRNIQQEERGRRGSEERYNGYNSQEENYRNNRCILRYTLYNPENTAGIHFISRC